jgi:aspartyl protease family protein
VHWVAARLLIVLVAVLPLSSAGAAEKLALHALFSGKAILMIDGKRRVLARGETSPEGVTLLETDTQREEAEIELDGKRQVLRLGVVISAFTRAKTASVTLFAEASGHFHADGLINGVPIRFMVDTGATDIAMNSKEAKRLGLDYKRLGSPGFARTASGIVQTYNLKLTTVKLGEITLHNVNAGVIEGNFPAEALLGMSFLGQLEMQREGNRLELIQKF